MRRRLHRRDDQLLLLGSPADAVSNLTRDVAATRRRQPSDAARRGAAAAGATDGGGARPRRCAAQGGWQAPQCSRLLALTFNDLKSTSPRRPPPRRHRLVRPRPRGGAQRGRLLPEPRRLPPCHRRGRPSAHRLRACRRALHERRSVQWTIQSRIAVCTTSARSSSTTLRQGTPPWSSRARSSATQRCRPRKTPRAPSAAHASAHTTPPPPQP